MSLTNFVKKSDVKDRIKEDFPNQGTNAEVDIVCEPNTKHYSLLGTAFDYLALLLNPVLYVHTYIRQLYRNFKGEHGIQRL